LAEWNPYLTPKAENGPGNTPGQYIPFGGERETPGFGQFDGSRSKNSGVKGGPGNA